MVTVDFTAPAGHSLSDYIRMFKDGEDHGRYRYVPEGPSGQVEFGPLMDPLGRYSFKYFTADDTEVAASTDVTVTVDVRLVVPSEIERGAPLWVNYTTHAGHSLSDYIELHKNGEYAGAYRYVPQGPTGQLVFQAQMDHTATYTFVYFVEEGDYRAATSDPIRITVASYSVEFEATTVVLGGDTHVTVRWTAHQGHSSNDYVALYSMSAARERPCILDGSCLDQYVGYKYAAGEQASGVAQMRVNNQRGDEYFARYIVDDTVAMALARTTDDARVMSNATLEAPATYEPNVPVVVKWASNYGRGSDEVVMYPASSFGCVQDGSCVDSDYIGYRYTNAEQMAGEVEFTVRDGATVFFAYLLPAAPKVVAVTGNVTVNLSGYSLSAPANAVSGLPLAVAYTAPDGHSTDDYVSMRDARSLREIDWAYVPAAPSGSVTFTAPDKDLYISGVTFAYVVADSLTAATTEAPTSLQPLTGDCDASCTNAGASCVDANDCSGCAASVADVCVIATGPEWNAERTPAADLHYPVLPGNTVSFKLETLPHASAPVKVFVLSAPESAHVNVSYASVEKIDDVAEISVAVTVPGDVQSTVYPVCFVVADDRGRYGPERCVYVDVKGTTCGVWGDPHFQTLDGLIYEFQGVGDFWLATERDSPAKPRSGAQIRARPCETSSTVTCVRAVALKQDNNIMSVYVRAPSDPNSIPAVRVVLNGELLSVDLSDAAHGRAQPLPRNLGQLTWNGYSVDVAFSSSFGVTINNVGYDYPAMTINFPAKTFYGKMVGTCGTWDGDQSNDLTYPAPGGGWAQLDPDTASTLEIYNAFQNMRVNESTSFFTYTAPFPSFAQANDATGFSPVTDGGSFADARLEAWADELCALHFPDRGRTFRSCMFDVAVTGELEAAASTVLASIQECTRRQLDPSTCAKIAPGCPNSCSFAGTCNAGKCTCVAGRGGADCSETSAAGRVNAPNALLMGGLLVAVVGRVFA